MHKLMAMSTASAVIRMRYMTDKQPKMFSNRKQLQSMHCLNDHYLNTCATLSPRYIYIYMTNDIEVYTKQYVCYKIQNISWYQKYAAYAGVKKAP